MMALTGTEFLKLEDMFKVVFSYEMPKCDALLRTARGHLGKLPNELNYLCFQRRHSGRRDRSRRDARPPLYHRVLIHNQQDQTCSPFDHHQLELRSHYLLRRLGGDAA
ncbi:hypothetical protein PTI98_002144 [Pleurotus ostreatus]|nr:hypothetical protein PTI98_002144 [Pleurotus ostreatus]